jgi:hypothetical protein
LEIPEKENGTMKTYCFRNRLYHRTITRRVVVTLTMLTISFLYSNLSFAAGVERTDITTLPTGYVKGSLVLSSDGKHYAYVVGSAGAQRIVCDGIQSQEFESFQLLVFSPTDKLFFWAMKDGNAILSADGRIITTSLTFGQAIVFSKDGAHWAAYGSVLPKQTGRIITLGGSIAVFIDGIEVGRYTDISYPSFNPDGKHLAWLALDSQEKMFLIIDGKVSSPFEKPKVRCSFIFRPVIPGPNLLMQSSAQYMSDGQLVTLARDANGWTVSKAGKTVSSYGVVLWGGNGYPAHRLDFDGADTAATIHARSLVIAEEAPVTAWWDWPSGKGSSWRVVIDGKPADSIQSANPHPLEPPVLSRDGKRIAYTTQIASGEGEKTNVYVIVDGAKSEAHARVFGIGFSDDAKHVAYAASDGNDWSYYMDGKQFANKYSSVYPPVLSVSGKHIVWEAIRDKSQILAVDGEEIGTTEEVLWGPRIEESGDASWVVREGTKVLKIVAKIK